MSKQIVSKRIPAPSLRARKGAEKIVALTAYTAPMAQVLDPHCDLLLVGDSLGMVVRRWCIVNIMTRSCAALSLPCLPLRSWVLSLPNDIGLVTAPPRA